MKATELRLNNLINIGGNTLETYQTYKPVKVTLAILNEIAGENKERPDAVLSVFQPIPLTEDILLRFNFTKINHIIDGVIYIKDRLRLTERFIADWRGGHIGEIESVHRLQNLYWCLVGEELILK